MPSAEPAANLRQRRPKEKTIHIREYRPDDERDWLRCRTLSFLFTSYFDDVKTAKTVGMAHSLVAEDEGRIIGLLDLDVDGDAATVDTVAVHPDHARTGVGAALLAAALKRVPECATLDAWTREDQPALRWYRRHGFVEEFRYLHVYAGGPAEATRAVNALDRLQPRTVFLHAPIEREAELRAAFARVYVCRRFVRRL